MAMIPEGRLVRLIRDWGPLFTILFLAGVAWNSMNNRVDQKLDTMRFVTDSIRVEAAEAREERDLLSQQLQLTQAINRLSQLICYQNPNPACR